MDLRSYGVRSFERSMLGFAWIKPIRANVYGLSFADEKKRSRWIDETRNCGRRAWRFNLQRIKIGDPDLSLIKEFPCA